MKNRSVSVHMYAWFCGARNKEQEGTVHVIHQNMYFTISLHCFNKSTTFSLHQISKAFMATGILQSFYIDIHITPGKSHNCHMGSDQGKPICINLTTWPGHIGHGGLDIGAALTHCQETEIYVAQSVFWPLCEYFCCKLWWIILAINQQILFLRCFSPFRNLIVHETTFVRWGRYSFHPQPP